jgi:hypothetical protein
MHQMNRELHRTIRMLTSALTASIAVVACSDQATAPKAGPSSGFRMEVTTSGAQYLNMDTPSDQLAKSIPGFGGAFVEAGALTFC